MKHLITAACLFALYGCATVERLTPSLAAMNSRTLNGDLVTVEGWLVAEVENYGIWDSRQDYENSSDERCISVLIPNSMYQAVREYNHNYVRLTGRLHRDVTEMPEIFMGLCNLTAIELTNEHPLEHLSVPMKHR